jgi:hypothetical protein
VYLGYVIGGGELKIDLAKMEAIMKWSVVIALFLAVATTLHTITTSGKSF